MAATRGTSGVHDAAHKQSIGVAVRVHGGAVGLLDVVGIFVVFAAADERQQQCRKQDANVVDVHTKMKDEDDLSVFAVNFLVPW